MRPQWRPPPPRGGRGRGGTAMNSIRLMALLALCAVASATAVAAAGDEAHKHGAGEEGVEYIKIDELRKVLRSDRPPILVNVLSGKDYLKGYIPGSVSLPLDRLKELAGVVLPAKDGAIVVYCANYTCLASTKAAKDLAAMGYTNVRDYKGGVQEWKKAGLSLGKSAAARTGAKLGVTFRTARKDEIGKNAVCPVMGTKFKVKSSTEVAEYGGKAYHFCCPGCKGPFKKDPGKHSGTGK